MIDNRINELKSDLDMFEDDLEKYEYIVDLGKESQPLEDNLKKDEFLVMGCTSKVWLIPEYKNGCLELKADSNSVIVKGLVSIIISIFQGLSPKEILEYNFQGLRDLDLEEIISPTRQNGVYHMVEKIKHYAQIYKE